MFQSESFPSAGECGKVAGGVVGEAWIFPR